jgi:hypothetical protein
MSEQARLDNHGLRYQFITNEDFRVKYLNLKKNVVLYQSSYHMFIFFRNIVDIRRVLTHSNCH